MHTQNHKFTIWLAHGENDEVFPANDAREVVGALRGMGADVRLDVFPGRGHNFGEDQPLLVRRAAEFCADALGGATVVSVNVRPAGWIYWLPVALLGLGWAGWCQRRACRARNDIVGSAGVPPAGLSSVSLDVGSGGGTPPELAGGTPALPAPGAGSLRWSAVIAAVAAVLVSPAHLALPLLRVNETTVKLVRAWNVRPELRADFDWLVSQPGARDCRIRDLLEHLNLAALQRGQFAASLPANEWREFVLSPWVVGAGEDIAWRRELWETLQPRLRRETDAEQAAMTIARQIGLRARFQGEQTLPANPRLVWWTGVGAREDFDRLYVAALRSVGIAAKLNAMKQCELFCNGKWQRAPRPSIDTQK